MTDSANTSVTEELALLEVKRLALMRIIGITQSLETLRQSLQAVTQLGSGEAEFPAEALKTFEALGRKVRNLSDAEINARLGNLDQNVRLKLKLVMELARELNQDISSMVEAARLTIVNNLIDEFKKHAQTAVALRVLLENRGVKALAFALDIKAETIKEQLNLIIGRESECRIQAIGQVESMQGEIQGLLNRIDILPALRTLLEEIANGLLANLEHIRAGKPISALPIPITDIEIDTTPFGSREVVYSSHASPHPESLVLQPLPETSATESKALPVRGDHVSSPPEIAARSDARRKRKHGFWARVRYWLNSPWSVRWKETDKD